jgi:hypothetical protein
VCLRGLPKKKLLFSDVLKSLYGPVITHAQDDPPAVGVRQGHNFLRDTLGLRHPTLEFQTDPLPELHQLFQFTKGHVLKNVMKQHPDFPYHRHAHPYRSALSEERSH